MILALVSHLNGHSCPESLRLVEPFTPPPWNLDAGPLLDTRRRTCTGTCLPWHGLPDSNLLSRPTYTLALRTTGYGPDRNISPSFSTCLPSPISLVDHLQGTCRHLFPSVLAFTRTFAYLPFLLRPLTQSLFPHDTHVPPSRRLSAASKTCPSYKTIL